MRSWFMTNSGTLEPVQDLEGRYHPDYIRDELPPEIYASCVAVAHSLEGWNHFIRHNKHTRRHAARYCIVGSKNNPFRIFPALSCDYI